MAAVLLAAEEAPPVLDRLPPGHEQAAMIATRHGLGDLVRFPGTVFPGLSPPEVADDGKGDEKRRDE